MGGHLRALASDQRAGGAIVVSDEGLDSSLFEALLEDGYHPFPGGMIAVTIRAALTGSELRERWSRILAALTGAEQAALRALNEVIQDPYTPSTAYQLEHQLRPPTITRLRSGHLDPVDQARICHESIRLPAAAI